VITASDFDEARTVSSGPPGSSNVLLPEEKHAGGGCTSLGTPVAALSEHADPVAKVTILPRPDARGCEQLPLVERHMYTEAYLHDSLAVRLGGRAAELVVMPGPPPARQRTWPGRPTCHQDVREFGLSQDARPGRYPEAARCSSAAADPACPAARSPRRPQRRSTGGRQAAARGREAGGELLTDHRSVLDALAGLLL